MTRLRRSLPGSLALGAALSAALLSAAPAAPAVPTGESADPHGVVGAAATFSTTTLPAAAGSPTDFSFVSSTTPPARWDPCDLVDWRLNPAGAPRDGVRLVHAAVAEVERVTGLRFRYLGTSSFVPTSRQATETGTDLSVAFSRPTGSDLWSTTDAPTGWAGISWRGDGVTADGARGTRTVAGRVLLNTDDFSAFDRWIDDAVAARARSGAAFPAEYVRNVHLMARNVVQHELGHVTGLGHATARGGQVMQPVAYADGTVTGWGAGDLAGLSRLGAAQGCLKTSAAASAAGTRPAAVAPPAQAAWQPHVATALQLTGGTTAPAPSAPAPAPTTAPAPTSAPAPVPTTAPTAAPVTAPTAAPQPTLTAPKPETARERLARWRAERLAAATR